MLGQIPDSHIERKHGKQYSELVATRMAQLSVDLASTDDTEQLMPMLYQLDKEFKSLGINPGTTADMTVATVFTAFLMDLVCESFADKADYLHS
jgi:triphosphoribosyl-dephospho-CoA synthase